MREEDMKQPRGDLTLSCRYVYRERQILETAKRESSVRLGDWIDVGAKEQEEISQGYNETTE